MTRRLPPALVALTPGTCTAAMGAELVSRVACAVQGGLQGLLLREPLLDDLAFLQLAERLRDVMKEGWFGIHDRAHLALGLHADALHLGFRSLAATEARRVVGADVTLGVSDHANDGPDHLVDADYRTFGPIHATPSKAGVLEPVGFEGLGVACAAHPLPTWALGGLNPDHARGVRTAGAQGVAVLRGILGDPDPAGSAHAYRTAWDESA